MNAKILEAIKNKMNTIENIGELKKFYFQLAKQYHPDTGYSGSDELIKMINNIYADRFEELKNTRDFTYDKDKKEYKTKDTWKNEDSSIFQDIISKIVHIPDIELEIVGYWLWISGETKPYRSIFKDLKCEWHTKKQMWYWYPKDTKSKYKSTSHGNTDHESVKAKYGCQKVHKSTTLALEV